MLVDNHGAQTNANCSVNMKGMKDIPRPAFRAWILEYAADHYDNMRFS